MPTNIANYQKISNLLIKAGCTQERIDELIRDKVTNRQKEKALEPLCNEFNVHFERKKKSPLSINSSLKDYFGVTIANLLVKRKSLLSLKEVNIDDIKTKNVAELSAKEMNIMKLFLEYDEKKSELKSIDSQLKNKGITIEK